MPDYTSELLRPGKPTVKQRLGDCNETTAKNRATRWAARWAAKIPGNSFDTARWQRIFTPETHEVMGWQKDCGNFTVFIRHSR